MLVGNNLLPMLIVEQKPKRGFRLASRDDTDEIIRPHRCLGCLVFFYVTIQRSFCLSLDSCRLATSTIASSTRIKPSRRGHGKWQPWQCQLSFRFFIPSLLDPLSFRPSTLKREEVQGHGELVFLFPPPPNLLNLTLVCVPRPHFEL